MRPQWSIKDHKVLSAFSPPKSDTVMFSIYKKKGCFNQKLDTNAFQAKMWIN